MPDTNQETLTSKITKVANAIRAKGGSTDKMTLDEMATAVSNIKTGSSGYTWLDVYGFLDDAMSYERGYSISRVSSLYKELENNLSVIPGYAFAGRSINNGGEFVFEKATSINASAFYGSQFRSLSFPKVTKVDNNAFQNCMTPTISLPEATSVGSSAFQFSFNLKYLNLPKVSSVGDYLCASSNNLKKVKLGGDIKTLDASSGWAYFYSCSKLTHVILSGNTVPSLKDASGLFGYLTDTQTESGNAGYGQMKKGCRIYVPQALLNDYKTATNWSVFADYILPIEEHQQECLLPGDEGYVEEATS